MMQWGHTKKLDCCNYGTLAMTIANFGKHQKICMNFFFLFVFLSSFLNVVLNESPICISFNTFTVTASLNNTLVCDLNLAIVIAK